MAEFHLIINDNDDMDLVASTENREVNSLLSDNVVHEWLMQLEADTAASEAPRRMIA
jgi:hypothetical protein